MAVEHKFISFTELKARNDGPGGWEGYLSKTGEIDDGGDLITQGAYTDTVDQFKERGFNAESHDWTFSRMIGFPTDAKEDDLGLYVTSQFHSTPDAQLVRTKVQERLSAGKGVYMSIGYETLPAHIERVEPDKYAEVIPQYSRKDMVEANLLKALQFPWIRVIRKVSLFEGSIVSVPMLRSAEVTAVKSADSNSLLGGLTLEDEGKQILDAVSSFKNRWREVVRLAKEEHENKVGAAISGARRTRISGWGQTLRQMADEFDELLEETAPKPPETDTDDEDTKRALAAEVNAITIEYYARQARVRALLRS